MSRLARQTSATDAVVQVAGLPELRRGKSKTFQMPSTPLTERRESSASDSPGSEEKAEEGGRTSTDEPEITFPDGGLRAWLVVFGAFWTVFCGFGLMATVGGFQTLYRQILPTYSESQISWITSSQAFFTFGMACFTGPMFDKYGHKPLIAFGAFCLVFGFCMLSLCTQYYQFFLVHATLLAWGCNLLFICPMGVLGQWFDKRRGMAFGLMSSGSSIGSVTWPTLLANLPGRIGFGWTCRVIALIAAAAGVTAFFLLKTRLPPKPASHFFYLEAFKNLEYCCVCANYWTFCFGFFAMMTYIGTYGELQGFSDFAPYLLVIQNGSSIFGRIGAGFLADRIGVYNTVLGGSSVIVVMFWVWLGCTTIPSCVALVVIIGVASGCFISLQGPMATMTAKDMRYGGTMVGQALFIQSSAQLICSPIFGALIGTGDTESRRKHFPRAIILGAVMILLSEVLVVLARLKRTGLRLMIKA